MCIIDIYYLILTIGPMFHLKTTCRIRPPAERSRRTRRRNARATHALHSQRIPSVQVYRPSFQDETRPLYLTIYSVTYHQLPVSDSKPNISKRRSDDYKRTPLPHPPFVPLESSGRCRHGNG